MAENTNKKKNSTTKKASTNKSGTTTKKNTAKKTAATKKSTTSKTTTKKNTTKKASSTKKTTTKPIEKKQTKKVEKMPVTPKKETINKVIEVTEPTVEEKKEIENKIVENIENITKIENAKFVKRKKKGNLIGIGVFVVILGLIALTISLIANRIIDREFLSDTAIALMVMISILIEVFGAFILINES